MFYIFLYCLPCHTGGNKHPLKRKPFRDVSQVALEEHLEQYCKHVGQEAAFDMKAYTHINTSEGADVVSMFKLLPLLWALLSSTVSKCI
jgi:hypothetical protein